MLTTGTLAQHAGTQSADLGTFSERKFRVWVPLVAGGARIDVPEPYARNEQLPIVTLGTTVKAIPIVDQNGAAGVQLYETISFAFYIWFPEFGPVSVFQGNPEYDPGCHCEVYDLGYQRLVPFISDESLLQELALGSG
jgi:hypothetical protein